MEARYQLRQSPEFAQSIINEIKHADLSPFGPVIRTRVRCRRKVRVREACQHSIR